MRPQGLFIVLLVFYNFFVIRAECPSDRPKIENYEADLEKDLFCSYNPSYRPVQDHRQTVTVEVGLIIIYISFDQTEEIFSVHSRLHLTWRDDFLKWDPANYGGIKEIQVRSYNIWIPRIALYNSDASAYQSDSFYTTCLVEYNGTVTCGPHDVRSGLCRTWLRRWPYDTQRCSFYFTSWLQTQEQVNFTFPSKHQVLYENFEDGPGWRLLNESHKRLVWTQAASPNDTYSMLSYTFDLQREAKGLEALIVVPCIVLFVLTTVTLLLDVKEDIRLALQCFSFYSHLMYLDLVVFHLPKQGMEVPIVLLLIRDSTAMALASIVLTLILTPLRGLEKEPPSWLMKLTRLLTSGPGKYVVFTGFEAPEVSDRSTLTEPDANEGQYNNVTWMPLANAINSIVFIIYVVVYIVLFCIYVSKSSL